MCGRQSVSARPTLFLQVFFLFPLSYLPALEKKKKKDEKEKEEEVMGGIKIKESSLFLLDPSSSSSFVAVHEVKFASHGEEEKGIKKKGAKMEDKTDARIAFPFDFDLAPCEAVIFSRPEFMRRLCGNAKEEEEKRTALCAAIGTRSCPPPRNCLRGQRILHIFRILSLLPHLRILRWTRGERGIKIKLLSNRAMKKVSSFFYVSFPLGLPTAQ